jgi:hypothetical protein
MKKLTKKIGTFCTATALAVTGLAAVPAGDAMAISRTSCYRNDFARIFSDNTTCWANAGYAWVHLFNVYRVWGGNNDGYIRSDNDKVYLFHKYKNIDPASKTHVVFVYIH